MEHCSHCDELPETIPDEGTLYINTTLEHTLGKLRKLFEENDFSCNTASQNILKVQFSAERFKSLSGKIRELLSKSEQQETKVAPVSEDREPGPEDLIGANSLFDLIGQIQGEWLIEMIQEERLFNVFQPIVKANAPDQIYGYECLLRGKNRDDDTVNPGRIFETADQANLNFQLDRQARLLAVRNSESYGIPPDRQIFINFLPTAIYDPEYCLNTTMQAIDKTDMNPEQFVFEVVESEDVNDREKLLEIISYYREKGFQVALDDFGAGYSSLEMLTDVEPDILKLDMGLVQKIPGNKMNTELCEQILTIASRHDITTLAEGIETRDQMEWFQNQDVDLAQGYLFARPDVPPPETAGIHS